MKNYIVYKITNKLNNYIYIGVHVTENIKDRYMGSGNNIKKIIKEIGKENFKKEILYNFNNKREMFDKEAELVNREFIARLDTYNIILGGGDFLTTDTISIKDKDDNYFRVHKTDSRYLSGKLVGCTIGKIPVIDKNGNTFQIDKNDKRYLSGELNGVSLGLISVKDKNGNTSKISIIDKRYLSGELIPCTVDMIGVKDKDGQQFQVSKNDEKYLSGELVPIWKDKKHTQETIDKMKRSKIGHGIGDKNSMYGKHHSEEHKSVVSKKLKELGLGKVTFYVYDIDGNFISEEKGICEYAKQNSLNYICIIAALKGRIKTSGKKRYYYEYKGEKLLLND